MINDFAIIFFTTLCCAIITVQSLTLDQASNKFRQCCNNQGFSCSNLCQVKFILAYSI